MVAAFDTAMLRALLSGAALACATPAFAQGYAPPPHAYGDPRYDDRGYDPRADASPPRAADEDIIVFGRRTPENASSASQHVSYADLDLRYSEDRRELRHRISLTARYLCERMGESDSGSWGVPSCREEPVRDAMRRLGTVEQHWAPRATAWTRERAWTPPYPAEWDARYP